MFFAKLLLLTISYLLSLLIFQRGLLLKRQVLRQQSNCTDVHANPACWIQHRYNRSIWLVIDALRYDFVAPLSYNATSSHFLGQMPLTSRLIVEQPEHTRLFHFTADAPTTTLQRLKALTTGTLPTFIEAGENFGGTEILEDNLVNQLVNQGKNVTFIGDDTWLSLLPKKFHRFFHAPSFDIKDLHTVDNLVLGKIYDEISRDDWSVLIAHTLGVDHCGHRYGLENFEMTAKLRQMDELVYNLTNLIDDDTILFVMGDHGMTKSGDHGGDSALEMDAALFVFSNKLPDYSNINFDFTDTVNQIDFVPTLSLLLDIPIPFSNLGKLIPSLFSPNQLTQAMRINCMQIIRFVQTYINQEPSFKESLEWLIREFESESQDDYFRYEKVVDNVLSVLRGAWTKFDISMIRIGIFSFLECLLFNLLQYAHCMSAPKASLSVGVWVFRTGLLLLQISLLIGGTSDAVLISMLDLTLSASIFYHLIQLIFHVITVQFQISLIWPFLFALVQGLSYTSNSFIIYESDVVRFLLQTSLVIVLVNFVAQTRTQKKGTSRFMYLYRNNLLLILSCMVAVRSGKLFERCREEQVGCTETIMSLPLSTLPYDETKVLRFVFGAISLLLLNIWFNKAHKKSGSSTVPHYSSTAGLTEAISWPVSCLIILHWLCDLVPINYDLLNMRTAQIVYVVMICHFITTTLFSASSVAFPAQFHMWTLVLGMILGDGFVVNLMLIVMTLTYIKPYFGKDLSTIAFLLTMVGSHGFFSFGHQASISMIPWQAAFVGIPGNFFLKLIPGLLIFLHLFAGKFLSMYSLFVDNEISQITDANVQRQNRHFVTLLVLSLSAIKVSGICIACVIHRRHLMIFKVFAPKFIFEASEHLFISFLLLILNLIYSIKR